jgi:hypothetical protein
MERARHYGWVVVTAVHRRIDLYEVAVSRRVVDVALQDRHTPTTDFAKVVADVLYRRDTRL